MTQFNLKNISITGDLGSGKSTVAKELCQRLGLSYFSTGSLQRKLAEQKGLNTLELNYLSEKDSNIDDYIDQYLKNINNDMSESYVLDSRLAWLFVDRSFKIYLTVSPEIAAERVLNDSSRHNEPDAKDLQERIFTLLERQRVENRRFKALYDVDCRDFNNYNLIIDSSYVSVDEIATAIEKLYNDHLNGVAYNKMWVSPKLLLEGDSTVPATELVDSIKAGGFSQQQPIEVKIVDSRVEVVDGLMRAAAAVEAGISFVPVVIA